MKFVLRGLNASGPAEAAGLYNIQLALVPIKINTQITIVNNQWNTISEK
ncbi:MAG: hypothetical protein H7Z13_01405 [Ferruginibacter sp.]|nr:hypothetical protein [Ferruginibacter sp.]